MNGKLSIIMPYLNEFEEPLNTIKSMRETSNIDNFEVIAIDDFSKIPTDLTMFPNVKSIKNEKRMGVDWSRHYGVQLAENDNILLIDGHMVFNNDNWLDKMVDLIKNHPKSLYCTICLALGYGATIQNHKGKYFGANLKLVTDAEKNRPFRGVIEGQWAKEKPESDYKISSLMGANYFFSKKWFNYVGGLRGLLSWGSSEPKMSLCSYLAGGDCRITKDIEIGHLFRDNAPYSTNICDLAYNKLYILKTIFPPELESKLVGYMKKDTNFKRAIEMIEKNRDEIERDRKYYQSIFTRSIYDFCSEFNIEIPK